ncbi:hypothetical protein MTO96_013076 [Rhipicephalus appendiculatus]
MPGSRRPSSDNGHADALANMDRCWNVPAAMAAGAFLICMPSTCFGLLFVLFMKQFGATREEAAWPENVFALASHLSGKSLCQIILECFVLMLGHGEQACLFI